MVYDVFLYSQGALYLQGVHLTKG